jgi:enediyne biosynthesis protein E4
MGFKISKFFIGLLWVTIQFSCSDQESEKPNTLFTEMPSDSTGISFVNKLSFDQEFNIYTYRNFYNGGGVGIGDINNDGLVDIYFTANQGANKLYLNKGNFQFEDITDKSGTTGTKAWSTGVSMADVNGDGWLDIYVSNSGDVKGDDKENELFINNHDLTFTDRADEYGVADKGYTTHAVFFDYDKDSDLDLYILNNSYQAIGSFNLKKNERPKRDPLGGDKLMRNDNNHFTDVSEPAGIYSSVIGFGLGVTVGDIDKDGWPDIYVSNDFFERDYLYINNRNGTFRECLTEQMKSISGASMGADLADINNDGWPDIFVTEMLPEGNERIKTVTTFENWDKYQTNVENDYYHQFTRNMLQLNNGNNSFSEIGRLADVEATDWSWGALIFDMDNDGLKDIFVANGIYQDLTNQDFLQYASSDEFVKSVVANSKVDYKKLVEIIPSTPQPNYAFRNTSELQFENKAQMWGLAKPGFSNGSAYGDLDNDGGMDLVVNNVNMEAFVYRNESKREGHHFLKFILIGEGSNTNAFGTKINVEAGGNYFYMEQMPIRGFESSVDPRPNVGLGRDSIVVKIKIEWPDGRIIELFNVNADQTLTLYQKDAKLIKEDLVDRTTQQIFENSSIKIDYVHKENDFVDFDRDRLLYHMVSCEGPKLSTGDLNNDGRTDIFIGGAKDQAGAMFIQTVNGGFIKSNESMLDADKISEDMGSVFFDADNDGDQDIYVCSGGNEFPASSSALIDRLYLNEADGMFKKSNKLYPTNKFESTSVARAADYDKDGDQDLFVGIRLIPFNYGLPAQGYILNNNGLGDFKDVTATVCTNLTNVGLITDAQWVDLDNDSDDDLIVVGEWMSVKIFVNNKGKLAEKSKEYGMESTTGWWNTLEVADVNNDGHKDLIVGNHGLNSRFKATLSQPVSMYVTDFDQNGSVEQIICTYNDGKIYPMALRHDLVTQLPGLKKKYLKYEDYKDQTITDIFTADQLKTAIKLEAMDLETSLFINNGQGKFIKKALPIEAQFSPVYAIEIFDFDHDGKLDIVMGGNLYRAKPEAGRYDASYGVFMKGDGKGGFLTGDAKSSGLFMDGEVRDFEVISIDKNDYLVVAKNNSDLQVFKIKK